MADDNSEHSDLWVTAQNLSSSADADVFFETFATAIEKEQITEPHSRAIFSTGLQSLMRETISDPTEAQKIILNHILPVCLEKNTRIDARLHGHDHLREFLGAWIEQYSDEQKIGLRKRVLAISLSAATAELSRAGVRTIVAIGFRTPEIVNGLLRLARFSDDLGDASINALTALGPNERLRERLTRRIKERVQTRPWRQIVSAIHHLADARFLPILRQSLQQPLRDPWMEVACVGRIADRHPTNKTLQRRIWEMFLEVAKSNPARHNAAIIVANGLVACNTPKVVPYLLGLLEHADANFNVIYNRLKECVRPDQLKGWKLADKLDLTLTLTPHATLLVGNTRSLTLEGHFRRFAWETAFSAGITDINGWLTQVLDKETGQYGQSDVLGFASWVRLDSWPETVDQLVLEEIDSRQENQDPLIARIRAVELLRATATKKAFLTVLKAGFTINGAPLRTTSEALGRLTEQVARTEARFALTELLSRCDSKEAGERRMLAVVGLQTLGRMELIPHEVLDRLVSVTRDASLPPYATAGLIWCVACVPRAARDGGFVAFLVEQIQTTSNVDIRFQSLQALLHLGIWKQYERHFLGALGLREYNRTLMPSTPENFETWQGHLLGLLVAREPQTFASAAAEVVARAPAPVVHILLMAAKNFGEIERSAAAELGRTAIQRSLKVLGSAFGETDNFKAISYLAPDQFAEARWEDCWGEWMPPVRAALADALGSVFPQASDRQRIRIFDLLQALLEDSTYQVRRSAARTYQRLDEERLTELCVRWIRSGDTSLRLRSAEIAQWLVTDDSGGLTNEILRKLKTDPEPSVRLKAEQSHEDLRARLWRKDLLDQLKSTDRSDGNQWFSECYRFGRALVAITDDEMIEEIRALSSDRSVPPNAQNWLRRLTSEAEDKWREITRKWPEPWLPWVGQLEEVEAEMTVGGEAHKGRLSLWLKRQQDPTDLASWGGAFLFESSVELWKHLNNPESPISLRVVGRSDSSIWLNSVGLDGFVSFVGTGPYPERAF